MSDSSDLAHTIFRPLPGPKSKGDLTTDAARSIIDAETSARILKTEKLKRLREQAEAAREPKPAGKAMPKKRRMNTTAR